MKDGTTGGRAAGCDTQATPGDSAKCFVTTVDYQLVPLQPDAFAPLGTAHVRVIWPVEALVSV